MNTSIINLNLTEVTQILRSKDKIIVLKWPTKCKHWIILLQTSNVVAYLNIIFWKIIELTLNLYKATNDRLRSCYNYLIYKRLKKKEVNSNLFESLNILTNIIELVSRSQTTLI